MTTTIPAPSTEPMTAYSAPAPAPAPAAATPWRRYLGLWRRFPRDAGYLALTALLLWTAYAVLTASVWGGIWSVFVAFGVALVVAALWAARGLGWIELVRMRWARMPDVRPVDWAPRWPHNAFTRLVSPIASGHYWLYLAHAIVVFPIVATITTTLFVGTLSAAVSTLVLVPILAAIISAPGQTAIDAFGRTEILASENGLPILVRIAVSLLLGVVLVAVLPFITRGAVLLHHAIDRLLLGGFRSSELTRRVAGLTASRDAAVSAEGSALRRLERDIHDGPQQRLVRLQMDLAAADRALDADPARARQLLDEAAQQARDALEELRALSRGFAPPLLLDRGLVAAIDAAAARSAVPVTLTTELLPDAALPTELERNAYFIVSELIANAVKHAGASAVTVRLRTRRIPGADEWWLDLGVADDGRGGAASVPGHGLAGLEERVRAFGGVLEISSPAGGPTEVWAHLPLTVAVGTGPVGTGPVGTGPVGTGPVGTGPVGTGPVGTGPVGTGPVGTVAVGPRA
ncbi:histidine kinase [Galbitalea sp. SE-J8]|uniref:sensor histidine kinase n=1 Tax=Galbitalea sp. SE-J8 TaxID=3054952 RepID=UPI00259CA60D|nr:histidine kinase [Galbitalea sp. SE-J8]MDM4764088.1 histidine kinase [Galbitalea sp. SE-J8]